MEQNREVFAVPGPADSLASRGCHRLIRDAARLVETVDDILEELGPLGQEVRTDPEEPPVRHPAELAISDSERSLLGRLDDSPTPVDDLFARGLRGVSLGFRGLRGVSLGFRGLRGVSLGFRGLRGVSLGFRGLRGVSPVGFAGSALVFGFWPFRLGLFRSRGQPWFLVSGRSALGCSVGVPGTRVFRGHHPQLIEYYAVS
jgi:hypothetical protein